MCDKCYTKTVSPPTDVGILILLKEYKEGALCHPSQKVYDAYRAAETVIPGAEDTLIGQRNVIQTLTTAALKQLTDVSAIECNNYAPLIMKKFVIVRVK